MNFKTGVRAARKSFLWGFSLFSFCLWVFGSTCLAQCECAFVKQNYFTVLLASGSCTGMGNWKMVIMGFGIKRRCFRCHRGYVCNV